MIIAHLARACYPYHPYGGLESHVYHLTLELARLGHRVELYTAPPAKPGQTVPDSAWQSNVGSHYIPYSYVNFFRRNSIPDRLANYPLFSHALGRAVRRSSPRPDIVHAHGIAGYGYAMQPLAGVPLVMNPHGMEEFKNTSTAKTLAYAPFRYLFRQTAHRAAATIATDQTLVPEVEQFLGVPPARIALIPNAVALDEIAAATSLEEQARMTKLYSLDEPDRFVMLSVGRLEPNKGFEVMLNALGQIRAELDALKPGWRWLLVGTGSQQERLWQEIERLGLAERVRMIGSVENATLQALYAVADLFVHPSLYEGSSLVTLEALAHSKPVVASAVGGLPDKIFEAGPYENGRLCPPNQPAELAKRLLEMVALPATARHSLGQHGRRLVEERFSWPAAARQTVALYEQILESRVKSKADQQYS